MAKSPEEMAATMIANLKDKTGKTLPQWLKIVKQAGLEKHGQIVKLLKADHEVTHGFANMIAHQYLDSLKPASSADDPVAAQYAGAKAELKPIYDAIIKAVSKFGTDVEISPKKAYVALRRGKQFGIVQPSTKTRVDVGINLKGDEPTERLEASGSFNSMVSHRVRLSSKGDVDRELVAWLKEAYKRA